MPVLDVLTLALAILVPLGVGIAPLFLPRAYLRTWGPLLSAALLIAAIWLVIALRDAPHPYHLAVLLPFGIGWLLSVFLMPMRIRGR